MADDRPRNNLSYEEACHAMQSGVAMEMNHDPGPTGPKHLRVGVNSAMCDNVALVRLLVKKGLFTWEEYHEEIRLEMNREVDRYEDRISSRYGQSVTLR